VNCRYGLGATNSKAYIAYRRQGFVYLLVIDFVNEVIDNAFYSYGDGLIFGSTLSIPKNAFYFTGEMDRGVYKGIIYKVSLSTVIPDYVIVVNGMVVGSIAEDS